MKERPKRKCSFCKIEFGSDTDHNIRTCTHKVLMGKSYYEHYHDGFYKLVHVGENNESLSSELRTVESETILENGELNMLSLNEKKNKRRR